MSRSAKPKRTRAHSTMPSSPNHASAKARRELQKVNVDFPLDLLRRIDAQAARLGVSRQSYIKIRMGDAIDAAERKTAPPRPDLTGSKQSD